MSTALFVDSLIRSIQVGSLYALMAIGLTLTLAVIKLPNFAHAELITVGAYVFCALCAGIAQAGEALATHFPYVGAADINELPDEISHSK